MRRSLTRDDFPLVAYGLCVYGKGEPAPLFLCPETSDAEDLVTALNAGRAALMAREPELPLAEEPEGWGIDAPAKVS